MKTEENKEKGKGRERRKNNTEIRNEKQRTDEKIDERKTRN